MKQKETFAIDTLRDIVNYFDGQNETINHRFKTVEDLITAYNYETINKTYEMFGDEKLYHAENLNCILGYKVYSTNQTEKNGKVSKPTQIIKNL